MRESMDRTQAVPGMTNEPTQQVNSNHRTSLILASLLLVHVGWIVWNSAINMPTIDFLTSWSVSHELSRKPIANIYSLDDQREMASFALTEAQSPTASDLQRQDTVKITQLYRGRIDATGTPFLYAVIGWFSSGNFVTDQKRFVFVCTLCLVVSLLLLKDLLRFSFVEISLLIMFIATYYAPVLADMQVGNVNEIQLLAVALFIFFTVRSQPLLAGLAIGTATMFKPTTAGVLVLSVIAGMVDRDYRQLLRMFSGCLIAAGASFLASAAYFRNPAIWLDFLQSLPKTLNGVSYSLQSGNFSLPALLFGATRGSSAVLLVVLLVAFSWLFYATRESRARKALNTLPKEIDRLRLMHNAFGVGGGGCAVMLLSSPLVWPHYYLLLLPLSLYAIRPVSDGNDAFSLRDIRIRRIAALALPFVLILMFSFIAELIVDNNAQSICILFILATISTLVLASYRIWQQRRALILSNPMS